NNKGSLEVGKLADLVILDNNPMTVSVDEIKDIQVMQTIKSGHLVYTRAE
ncbi:MAG: putative amidohydrolase YtcJ, partial [Flavobacteriales bacterium]